MDSDRSYITKSPAETAEIGAAFANTVTSAWKSGNPDVPSLFFLYGDLGSGKTTFSQGFAGRLGITSRLLSPTFIIVRRYNLSDDTRYLYHLDLYRTHTARELDELGIDEIVSDRKSCVLVEWAEKFGNRIPGHRTDIFFTVLEDGTHEIKSQTHI
jgi:tRNA threonylcarbamoyladenosine biosynthesis protein TsaE